MTNEEAVQKLLGCSLQDLIDHQEDLPGFLGPERYVKFRKMAIAMELTLDGRVSYEVSQLANYFNVIARYQPEAAKKLMPIVPLFVTKIMQGNSARECILQLVGECSRINGGPPDACVDIDGVGMVLVGIPSDDIRGKQPKSLLGCCQKCGELLMIKQKTKDLAQNGTPLWCINCVTKALPEGINLLDALRPLNECKANN
jgi:hypothetical protein